MTTTLPLTGLRTCEIGDDSWAADDRYNWQRLNDTLLKLSALLDVDVSGIGDDEVLSWNSATSKWEPRAIPYAANSTTTTTTSTTTTTTT